MCGTAVVVDRRKRFRCPGNAPSSPAAFVADNVRNAELFIAETCGHLIWLSDDAGQAREKVTSFLQTTLSGAV